MDNNVLHAQEVVSMRMADVSVLLDTIGKTINASNQEMTNATTSTMPNGTELTAYASLDFR